MRAGAFDDDAMALWEFARCQRPDGSIYGTKGQCRKGKEVGAEESTPKKKEKSEGNLKPDFEKGGTLTKGNAITLGGEPFKSLLKRKANAEEMLKKYPDEEYVKEEVDRIKKQLKPFENNERLLDGILANVPKGTEVEVTPMGAIRTTMKTPSGNEVTTTFKRGSFNFQVNGSYDAGSVTQGRAEEMAVARQVARVFNAHRDSLPEGFVVMSSAHTEDGRGASRQRAYERMGFSTAKPGDPIYGKVEKGKIVPSNIAEEGLGSTLLTFSEESENALWYIAVFGGKGPAKEKGGREWT